MPRPDRLHIVHAALLLFLAALIGRAAQVQLWEGGRWQALAQRQHYADTDVPATRGDIFDATGTPLAESRELVRLSIAPRELRDPAAAARALRALGVPASVVRAVTDRKRVWLPIPGHFLPGDAAALTAMAGVYPEPVVERIYTSRAATQRVVGRVDAQGDPVDGIELALDSLLRGRAGKATLVRTARGSRFQAPLDTAIAPRPGDAVVLTINQELQEIVQRALDEAVDRMKADGGDIVVLDPQSGEIRAMASARSDPRSAGSPAVSEPFEPGSTMKPFMAARLLMLGRARPDEMMSLENGVYTLEGRTIEDDHSFASLSLSDVIRYSSNIGIVKFSSRLTPREEFETLRDAGFGSTTGIDYPAESRGILRPPDEWSRQSAASLAMGYEIAVTPLQLATAYAAIANGGELLQPALVKEVRTPDGRVRYRHERRVARRIMSPEVAATVRGMLRGAVEGGTATQAELGSFEVAGKTGTARVASGHGYFADRYHASFVGLFPADHPQYVILVKLDNPTTSYYGGKTAAPVSRVVLEAAIAARDAALDRTALAASQTRFRDGEEGERLADAGDAPPAQDSAAPPAVFTLPVRAARAAPPSAPRSVPDVRGLPMRQAAFSLHQAGFRVQAVGFGTASTLSPSAGSVARAGTLVRLAGGPR